MEKTVDINENSQFIEDLEMFKAAPDENLQSFIEEGIPENSENGLGSFKFPATSNPLEQLGLYMKNEDEEEEVEPQKSPDTVRDLQRPIDWSIPSNSQRTIEKYIGITILWDS